MQQPMQVVQGHKSRVAYSFGIPLQPVLMELALEVFSYVILCMSLNRLILQLALCGGSSGGVVCVWWWWWWYVVMVVTVVCGGGTGG